MRILVEILRLFAKIGAKSRIKMSHDDQFDNDPYTMKTTKMVTTTPTITTITWTMTLHSTRPRKTTMTVTVTVIMTISMTTRK